ncbi:2Fe-2S iron-sulfur cluster-binding protein [Pseudonocardia hydrocarbonoxydans]|uniref:Carbon monoxide dehydrogenase n=1 Tax=Pseudonocardia hydrocarbonoxydans TaxID=76726 RepID=A0A4Y3WH45_9PSEU|nr:2Fe-2S iron-sulfur cluster-binding protein [Pseudonocardia hydrocarbonoxydans]GEC18193.1 carbon monoxide dehydrogenase [Pseudonocardia hydrocarbonoxydans]
MTTHRTAEPAPAEGAAAPTCAPARGRVGAHDVVEVEMTVNGSAVTFRVPPRMHLADALREQSGLTGTHLGCEHGVCGMCTVLVDGEAARACLLLAVQCEGAEVVTVEGLGSAEEQHPLQEAFSHHHGLQCGFCTPGMLMSSYDLLANSPDRAGDDELPEQMSGVLCRCTGYRGILAAVSDVHATHPDGVPGPRNCAARTLVGRGSGSAPAGPPTAQPDSTAAPVAEDVTIPTGAPTVTVTLASALAAPVDAVAAVVSDVERLVACLPGAELTETLPGDRYRGRAGAALGPVKLSFEGLARVVERDPQGRGLRLVGQGRDTGGSATSADIRLHAEPDPGGGTVLRAEADLFLSGRIAQFGRALAGDVSRRLFEQFAAAVDESARTGTAPTAAPVGGVRLALRAVRDAIRGALRRLRRG